ncbi:uncharacterized protein [Linepithema humile]|uniref:uncharacterized protein n=1 Tax=Linepithema humile TaxID=83485 RepID=UPI00351F2F83
MQELWLARLEWDDSLPTDIQTRWVDYREQLTQLFEIRIPRWVGRHHENLGVEIHGFADASTRAYAAAVYLRVIHSFSEIRTHLLVARTKVAPIKTISIPRLELNAIVLLSRLITWVSTALDYGYVPRYGWTDSTVALAWVSQHPSRWKTYVANRVSEIQSVNPTIKWNHAPSEQNPADCASRGISTSDLKTHPLWWNGPLWLRQPSPAWPDQTKREGVTRTILTEAARASVQHVNGDPEWDLPDTYSTWTSLVRATANAKKFIAKLKARHTAHGNFESTLTCEELKNAELFWLTTVQTSQFALELESLQKTGSIHRSSRLKALQPFIGEDKLLHIGGRLERAFLSYAERHPIILADHRVVRLLISKTHKVTLHGGTQLTLRVLRQQYWIISARSLVKQHIRNCVICVRNRAKPLNQKMAALPARRVNPAPPFSSVGLDYAGPFLVTTHAARGQRTYKHFVAVFVCFVTKAVHLECVEDYSTSAFLAAFSRFTSRRGLPTHVHSDNGTNFQGADRELYRAWKSINNDEELRASVVNDKISWHFSPPAAPHFGGLWEAAVKGFKLHFKRIAGARTLSRAEFVTLLCKIEACLNSRPLAAQSDDPSDLAAITPGHFLIGRPLLAVPEESVAGANPGTLSRWQHVREMEESFWRRWSQEYLHSLQTRSKWTDAQANARIGELVLLKDKLLPPTQWKLARIVETHPGSDGLVRVVTLRTANSELRRPIVQTPINSRTKSLVCHVLCCTRRVQGGRYVREQQCEPFRSIKALSKDIVSR